MRSAPALAALFVLAVHAPLFLRPAHHGGRDWGKELLDATAAREAIVRHGEPPVWNRYCGGGNLLAGNPETFGISPAFGLVLLLGAPLGIKASLVAHALLGAWGMGRLVGALGGSVAAASLGGAAWAATGNLAVHLAVGHVQWQAGFLLPWVVAPWLGNARRGVPAAAAALGLVILDGGVHVALVALVALGTLALARAAGGRSAEALLVVATVAAGLLLAGVKLVPALALLRADPHRVASHRGFDVPLLVSALLVPPGDLDAVWDGVDVAEGGGIWEYSSYVGILVLPLVLAALIGDPRIRGQLDLWALALAGLTFSMELPGSASPWRLLHLVPPFAMERRPSRFVLLTVLVVVVWGALGLDELAGRRARLAALVAAGLALDLGVATGTLMAAASSIPPPRAAACPEPATLGGGSPYANALGGCGTVPCRQGLHLPQAARAASDPGYRGEAFVVGTAGAAAGTARISGVTSRTFDVAYEAPAGGLVVLNQNDWPGFEVQGGVHASHQGLVAARVAAGAGSVRFVARGERSLVVAGALASLLGLAGLVLLHRASTGRERPATVP